MMVRDPQWLVRSGAMGSLATFGKIRLERRNEILRAFASALFTEPEQSLRGQCYQGILDILGDNQVIDAHSYDESQVNWSLVNP